MWCRLWRTSLHEYADTKFLSKTQLVMINQMQDISTEGLCQLCVILFAVDKDLRVETSCIWFYHYHTVVSCSRMLYPCIINAAMSLYSIMNTLCGFLLFILLSTLELFERITCAVLLPLWGEMCEAVWHASHYIMDSVSGHTRSIASFDFPSVCECAICSLTVVTVCYVCRVTAVCWRRRFPTVN